MDQYHHGNLKATLVKAAFQLVNRFGVEGFTLREVARRAGVSHNAPYRHFRSKEDLVAALAAEGFRQLHRALRKGVDGAADPQSALRAASRAYLHFGLSNPARFHVMFHAAFERQKYGEYTAAYGESLALLSELLRACGPVLSQNAALEATGELIWASVHGITELGMATRLRHGVADELEHLVDASVDSLLRGLGYVA